MTVLELRNQLAANITKLAAGDVNFAQSLLTQYDKRGTLSPKQAYWFEKLALRAAAPPPAPLTAGGSFKAVYALFGWAKGKLKWPKLTFQLPSGAVLKLTLSGPASKVPGVVNAKDPNLGTWYGRIQPDGTWTPGRAVVPQEVKEAIQAIAADPAGAIGANGRLTGHCSFCSLPLTDQRSLKVGYGPVCAVNFGLAWGEKPALASV